METKPKLDFSKTKDEIIADLKARLGEDNNFHDGCEVIVCSLMNMMLEKTLMYGGDDNNIPLNDRILREYYGGIARKANRLPKIVKRSMDPNDKAARKELIDTILDIAGYSIISLSSFAKEIQDE